MPRAASGHPSAPDDHAGVSLNNPDRESRRTSPLATSECRISDDLAAPQAAMPATTVVSNGWDETNLTAEAWMVKDMRAFDEDDEAVINLVPSRPPRKRARAPAPAVDAPWDDTAIMQAYDAAVKRGPLDPAALGKNRLQLSSSLEEDEEKTEKKVKQSIEQADSSEGGEEDRNFVRKKNASKQRRKQQNKQQLSDSEQESPWLKGLMALPNDVRNIAESFYNAGYLSGYAVGFYIGSNAEEKSGESACENEEDSRAEL